MFLDEVKAQVHACSLLEQWCLFELKRKRVRPTSSRLVREKTHLVFRTLMLVLDEAASQDHLNVALSSADDMRDTFTLSALPTLSVFLAQRVTSTPPSCGIE